MRERSLGWRNIAGYGVGDFGFNLFYTGLNLYLLFYYTDVLAIDPAVAGLIFMLPVIWDGITDPLMGWIATRTRTRYGRFRPYLLFGAPLMGLGFVAMFAAPLWFPSAIVVSSAIAHVLFRTLYTVVSIPYSCLSAAMTRDSQVRGNLAGVRMIAAMLGGLLTAAVTLRLAQYFGAQDLRHGFVVVSAIFAGIATLLMVIVFRTTWEVAEEPRAKRISTAQTLDFLRRNRAFWILFAAVFASALGSSIGSKALVYYVAYFANQPDLVSAVLTAGLACAALSIPLWTLLSRRLSKRNVWLIAATGTVAVQATLLLTAPRDMALLIGLNCANGLFAGATAVMFWAMLPDTVEYGQWRSRIRDEGIVFGLNQLALKAASGIGVGVLGLALGAIGYQANEIQVEQTLSGLRLLAFGVPMVASAIGLFIISFYPIDQRLHARLRRGLAWRGRQGYRTDSADAQKPLS